MRGLNQWIGIGNLGKDLEVKRFEDGKVVASTSMAINEDWKDSDGNKHEKTEWVNLVVWGKLADIFEQYLHKGSKVFIQGRIQSRSWDKEDGTKGYKTEIVVSGMQMLDRRASSDSGPQPEEGGPPAARAAQSPGASSDDLPF